MTNLLNFSLIMDMPGETEEEFSTRLANNLENLILKEGPDTVSYSNIISGILLEMQRILCVCDMVCLLFSDSCVHR